MTKKYYPFLIALFLHIFIVIIIGLLIEDAPSLLITQSKNLINVNVSSSENTAKKGSLKKSGKISKQPNSQGIGLNLDNNIESENKVENEGSSGVSFGDAVISFKGPDYPRLALRRGIEGSLKIKIVIATNGVPQEIIVVSSSGHEILDNAAILAVKSWRFEPRAQSYAVTKTIVFQIKN